MFDLKILVIGYLHKKYDKRVFRTVDALSKNHEVIYQYCSEKIEEPYFEDNINFVPVHYVRDKDTPPLKELLKRRSFDSEILNMIKSEDFDVLYLHHFLATKPLEPFKIAKKLGKKIVYDIHEYHPYNFLNGLSGVKKRIKERVMFRIFRKQLEYSDRLIFVSPEIEEDVFRILKIKRDVLIVPNYASKGVESSVKDKEIVLVGGTKRYLDDEKIILKELIRLGWKFKVIGIDTDFLGDVEHEHTGFLPYDEMLLEISKASFSLNSYNITRGRVNRKNDVFALPHKFFDSLAAETPVIVNKKFVSTAKMVEELGIGVVIDTDKPNEAVKEILKAYDDYEILIENVRKHKYKFIWNEEKEREFVNFVCD